MRFFAFVILVLVVLIQQQLFAQDMLAEETYYTADDHIAYKEYAKALPLLLDLEKNDKENPNFQFMIGMCYYHTGDYTKATTYLSKAILKTDIKFSGSFKDRTAPVFAYYYMGKTYHATNKIDDAITNYDKYKSFLTKGNKDILKDVDHELGICYNARKYIKYPLNVNIKNLGAVVNTTYPDYSPIIFPDNKTLVFTSRRKGSTGNLLDNQMKYYEDIYLTKRGGDGIWSAPERISVMINSSEHEACLSVSADGTKLLIYKAIDQNGDIFESTLSNGSWSIPKALNSTVNSKFQESHACLSPDGKTIYFVSNRSGGFGGNDIYKAKMQADGTWGKAENLGPSINTIYNEEAPFMHVDGVTLYFSSQGHENIGGYDIFTSKVSSDGFWSVPVNIGYPLNTTGDDVFYNPSTDKLMAYFSSVRPEGVGLQDVYQVDIIKEKELFAIIKGTVTDPVSFKPIDVRLEVKDALTKETVALVRADDSTGIYNVALPADKQYSLEYSADNFNAKTETVKVDASQKGKEIDKNMQLNPVATTVVATETVSTPASIAPATTPKPTTTVVKTTQPKDDSFPLELVTKETTTNKSYELKEENYATGEKFIMNNIYFDYGKDKLSDASMDELNRLVNFLKQLTNIKVEISGHTDNVSSREFNLTLSEQRAKSVVNYLIKSGIAKDRLSYKGYAFDQPIATNTTDEGRAANRRTEIKITGGGKLLSTSSHNANAASMTTGGNAPASDVSAAFTYKVQFATSSSQKSLTDPVFKGITGIEVYQDFGIYKYTIGSASSRSALEEQLLQVKQLGFNDAFIVRFDENKRVGSASVSVSKPTALSNENVIYRIQVTAIKTEKSINSPDFKGLQGLVMEQENGVYKYFIGKETSYDDALKLLKEVQSKGFPSAFIKKL